MRNSDKKDIMRAVEEVVSPISIKSPALRDPAPSIPDLNGKTICELWNYAFQGDRTSPFLDAGVRSRYLKVKFVPYTEFGNLHGNDEAQKIEELPGKLKRLACDAVISGNGG